MASQSAQTHADVFIDFMWFFNLNHFYIWGDLLVYPAIDHFLIITSYCDLFEGNRNPTQISFTKKGESTHLDKQVILFLID